MRKTITGKSSTGQWRWHHHGCSALTEVFTPWVLSGFRIRFLWRWTDRKRIPRLYNVQHFRLPNAKEKMPAIIHWLRTPILSSAVRQLKFIAWRLGIAYNLCDGFAGVTRCNTRRVVWWPASLYDRSFHRLNLSRSRRWRHAPSRTFMPSSPPPRRISNSWRSPWI